MELTKFEKKVLTPEYAKTCRRNYLYLGLVFIVVGLAILVHGYLRPIPQSNAAWEQSLAVLEKVTPMTNTEKGLLEMSTTYLKSAKSGWNGFLKEKTKNTSMYFIFVGIYLTGSFFRESRYNKLLLKLKS